MRYRRKKNNKKNYGVYFHAEKNGMCTGKKNAKSKCTHKIHRITKYRTYRNWFWVSEMLLKFIIVYLYHVGGFFSFHLKVNVVEDLISFGIEDHTFRPIKVREHFPEEELTIGKNRLLDVASLVE